jgi:hypothetical protein
MRKILVNLFIFSSFAAVQYAKADIVCSPADDSSKVWATISSDVLNKLPPFPSLRKFIGDETVRVQTLSNKPSALLDGSIAIGATDCQKLYHHACQVLCEGYSGKNGAFSCENITHTSGDPETNPTDVLRIDTWQDADKHFIGALGIVAGTQMSIKLQCTLNP